MARIAKSLEVLLGQINNLYPDRSKVSDGGEASAAHHVQNPNSDHEPNEAGVVTAYDFTNDPAHGLVASEVAEKLRQSRDPRIKYIISNSRIANYQALQGEAAWAWRPYNGTSPHDKHFHISVRGEPELYDNTDKWDLGANVAVPADDIDFKGITATVFGTADDGLEGKQTTYGKPLDPEAMGVALPARFTGERPKVRIFYHGRKVENVPVVDIGPWNTTDPYWSKKSRPQAETGTDTRGRKTNKAGIDLTPATAEALGLPGKGLVDWEFMEGTKPPPPPPVIEVPIPDHGQPIDWAKIAKLYAIDWSAVERLLDESGEKLAEAKRTMGFDFEEALRSGKTGAQIAEEKKMADGPSEVVVETKPWYAQKTFWLAFIAGAAPLISALSKGKINIDPTTQDWIAGIIATVAAVAAMATSATRTTVTPGAAAKLNAEKRL